MRVARVLLCVALGAGLAMAENPNKPERGFKALFDGKTLKGWDGDPKVWRVENGEIVGSTEGNKIKHNTFLISQKEYSNFVLRAQVKLRNHNSGIQFRSKAQPDWIVAGLQADMAEGNWWGSIYDERGKRGVIVNGWKGKAEKVVKPTDWNDVEISAIGEDIKITVNGLVTSELKDTSATSGILALQVHQGPPMEVRFRKLRIREVKK